MPKDGRSWHTRVLDYFSTADLGEAQLLFNLVKDTVKKRSAKQSAPAPIKRRHRRIKSVETAKPKHNGTAVPTGSHEPLDAA